MLSIYSLFEIEDNTEKVTLTKNYVVEDFKDKPKENFISKWRRKVIFDKMGRRHLLNLAILNKTGRESLGKKEVATSLWHPKEEKKAQNIAKEAPKVEVK
jgi:hypothetical protein